MNNIIKTVFSKIILIGLPLFYFLMAVSFYLGTYDSAQIKITITQIGGVFLIFSWVILKLETDLFLYIRKNYVVVLPILLFLISGLFSYVFSPFKIISFNEVTRRVIYCFLSLIVIDCFRDKDAIKRLINVLIFATYIVCIYAVIQFIDTRYFPYPPEKGLDPFAWRWAFGNRIFSTFGNPNFFGDFLIVMAPITLALFFQKKRFHLLFLWVLIVFSIFVSYSKGAWLGFGAGLIIFSYIFIRYIFSINRKKKIILLSLLIFFTVIIVSSGIIVQLKARHDSSSFRLFTWMSCWEMINTHPILGTGIGTFYVTYPSYRRPQIFFIEGAHNTESDHPENEYLEVFYDEGAVGLGIFLLILLTVLFMGFKNIEFLKKNNQERSVFSYLQLGLLSALISQLVHDCVCVSLRFVSSGVMLWLIIGLVLSISLINSVPKEVRQANLKGYIKYPLQILILAISIYLIYVFYGFFVADKLHSYGIQYSKVGNWSKAIEMYSQVIEKNKSYLMARYFKANNFNDRWQNDDPQKAIDTYKELWKLAPNYVQSKYMVGLVYSRLWEYCKDNAKKCKQNGDNENLQNFIKMGNFAFNESVKYLEQYKKIDPIFPLTYYRLAWLYMQIGKFEEAKKEYFGHLNYPSCLSQKPHDLYVEDWQQRRKYDYAQTYVNLGNLEYMVNNIDLAENYYIKALSLQNNHPEALRNLSVIYERKNENENYNKVVKVLKQFYPNDSYVSQMAFK